MSTNVETKLTEIKEKISKARERKLRAEVEIESAEAKIETATKVLQEKFKISTIDEADELITKLEANLESKIKEAEVALAEVDSV